MTNNKYEVTKDQYTELVNKAYKGEIEFDELDKYEIILPFAPEHDNEAINELIIKICTDARKEEKRTLFIGHARNIHHELLLENGFKYMSKWSDGYRNIYVSEPHKAIVTYCEGDFSVCLMDTMENYLYEFNRSDEFYKEY